MGTRFLHKKDKPVNSGLPIGFKDTKENYFRRLAKKAALSQLAGFFTYQESILIYLDSLIPFFKMPGGRKGKLYIF